MNVKLFFLGLLFVGIVSAQEEFSFQLYFEDAIGNRDTITLGYDPLATDTIDVAFGEENILNQPWSDSTLDVRITDKMPTILYDWLGQETFRTKKQIVESYCMTTSWEGRRVFVDVKNAVFPITMSFDTQLYQDSCVHGSTMDVLDPELHIDPVEGPPEYFFDWIFYKKNWNNGHYTPYSRNVSEYSELIYKDVDDKHIFTYLITLQDNRWVTLNSNDLPKENFQIYPNPTTDIVTIDIANNDKGELLIYQLDGTFIRKQSLLSSSNVVSIRDLNTGVYFFEINSDKGTATKKIIKN
ncbi:MAG TPA: T9SS type A sorting domain-containing protein [Crocinitomicaceae bacterium]|nr:T9SS type A sorting domain-containing protein [Crocinitomicaceae bacterium]